VATRNGQEIRAFLKGSAFRNNFGKNLLADFLLSPFRRWAGVVDRLPAIRWKKGCERSGAGFIHRPTSRKSARAILRD
jgi:hypothetical protein